MNVSFDDQQTDDDGIRKFPAHPLIPIRICWLCRRLSASAVAAAAASSSSSTSPCFTSFDTIASFATYNADNIFLVRGHQFFFVLIHIHSPLSRFAFTDYHAYKSGHRAIAPV